jgi:Arc/MetJ-type ribon-helix-helix transcriptional regulator
MDMSRNKQVLTATISPMTRRQLDTLVKKDGLFASGSDAVEKSINMMYYAVHQGMLDTAADGAGVIMPV